jgi:bla regulator protein blaR1
VSYASALLHLEKSSGRHQALALAAAGKQNLLTRIEKIVGMEKKKPFRLVQVVPLFLAMFCVLLFNSVLIIRDAKSGDAILYASNTVLSPWQLDGGGSRGTQQPASKPSLKAELARVDEAQSDAGPADLLEVEVFNLTQAEESETASPVSEHIVPVNFDEIDGNLSKEEKENVETTVEATRKAAKTIQWKAIEHSIGDAMDRREKAIAKLQYMNELEKVRWNNIEQNLKANYDKLNWDEIKLNVDHVMLQVKMDSLQTLYAQALAEIEKTEKTLKAKAKCSSNPLPDISVDDLQLAKETLQKRLDSLNTTAEPKKVIRL